MKKENRGHIFKGCYKVEIIGSLILELQLEDIEYAIKDKLENFILSELRGCKFVAPLVLVLKKIEIKDKKMANFIHTFQTLLIKATLMMYFNMTLLQLYQTYKKF